MEGTWGTRELAGSRGPPPPPTTPPLSKPSTNLTTPPKLFSLMENLKLPYLSKLMNYHIICDANFPPHLPSCHGASPSLKEMVEKTHLTT